VPELSITYVTVNIMRIPNLNRLRPTRRQLIGRIHADYAKHLWYPAQHVAVAALQGWEVRSRMLRSYRHLTVEGEERQGQEREEEVPEELGCAQHHSRVKAMLQRGEGKSGGGEERGREGGRERRGDEGETKAEAGEVGGDV
jgi:hypothetical protein